MEALSSLYSLHSLSPVFSLLPGNACHDKTYETPTNLAATVEIHTVSMISCEAAPTELICTLCSASVRPSSRTDAENAAVPESDERYYGTIAVGVSTPVNDQLALSDENKVTLVSHLYFSSAVREDKIVRNSTVIHAAPANVVTRINVETT